MLVPTIQVWLIFSKIYSSRVEYANKSFGLCSCPDHGIRTREDAGVACFWFGSDKGHPGRLTTLFDYLGK